MDAPGNIAAAVSDAAIRDLAGELLPDLVSDLVDLAAIESVAMEGFPTAPLLAAHRFVAEQLADCGVTRIDQPEIPGTTAPVLLADLPGPPGAPTVLIYTHYDVVPAGDLSLWDSPPFAPVHTGDAVVGRGVADSKANIIAILGALRILRDRLPVTVTLVIEGHEEYGSPFVEFPVRQPERFAADAMVIADLGNVRPGSPTLTVALRGSATVTVGVRTLSADRHSGQYGGAAPDARLALIRALATLHDDAGDVAVRGLRREPWDGASPTEGEFRQLAGVADGAPLLGTGTLGERICSGPAITVTAFDAPPAEAPINSVAGTATAVLNLRVHPEQDAVEAQSALVEHLRSQHPFGLTLEVTAGETGNGFAAPQGGPAHVAARHALSVAWGVPTELMAGGGSIPIVMSLHRAAPGAEVLMFGATDGYANIHAPNERVLVDELERTVVALAVFLRDFGGGAGER